MAQQPEIWGGIECTVNRVRDQFFDQLVWNGHAARIQDLDLFAQIGIRTIRYPILWERIAPNGIDQIDWSWSDARLGRLKELGIRPIVGLVHHGSGPIHTSLIDPDFPKKLAEYAQAVAERYPWISAYTPINEPLTTARFCGLYGHWYPHGRDEKTFLRALLSEVRATQLAMKAVRTVNPQAQLIQTEDLGKTFCTPKLDNQADYENTRRWLSLDLLCGRMTKAHSLYGYYLESAGITEAELSAAAEDACPPDIIGLNYYVTSERFLDERLDLYPEAMHGGNGEDRYVDNEVVRVCIEGMAGIGVMLTEVWERYHLPMAVTEVHLGSTRDEQLRWLHEMWTDVTGLGEHGIDIRAVTIWSLLGAYNWNSLVTRDERYYEPGVFDLRSEKPRPTALAKAVMRLCAGEKLEHPVLDVPGWWRRPDRLLFPPTSRRDTFAYHHANHQAPAATEIDRRQDTLPAHSPRKLLITGATGTLGKAFSIICEQRGLPYQLVSRKDMDITDPDQIQQIMDELKPWAVINTAGYVRVDQAEREPARCLQVNAVGPLLLASACRRQDIPLLTFSSDLVFDGKQFNPYLESSPAAPLNIYGISKARAEKMISQIMPNALIIRTSAFFGPWDEHNFAAQVLRTLQAGDEFVAAHNLYVSPTYVPDLVNASLDLLIDGEDGLWHLANQGAVSWFEFAQLVAETNRYPKAQIRGCGAEELKLPARRPAYSVLGSERGMQLPSLEHAIARYYLNSNVV